MSKQANLELQKQILPLVIEFSFYFAFDLKTRKNNTRKKT